MKEYGGILRYHGLLNRPYVLVTDANIIKEILVNQAYDFRKPNVIRVLGKGIEFAEGDTHKIQRKIMNLAFSHDNVKVYILIYIYIKYDLNK